jgi:NitT/TauT family transport system permease protein
LQSCGLASARLFSHLPDFPFGILFRDSRDNGGVANIPAVYSRVANDYGLTGSEKLMRVTLPAIMPQVITSLRVAAGVAWLVVVAAEMIAGRDGLGFAVMDSRNALRTDLLVVAMIVFGCIGVAIDRLLVQLTKIPRVRRRYER